MSSEETHDVVGQAGLLWKMIYGTLLNLQSIVPGLRVVRHEDLALAPVEGFRGLYKALGLAFTPGAERAIRDASSAGNPVELSRRGTHAVKMDSRASLQNWKRRLSSEEVAQVRRLTEGVSAAFYPDGSWN
jgi:hypothetical protein